jgi:hypothetical protein
MQPIYLFHIHLGYLKCRKGVLEFNEMDILTELVHYDQDAIIGGRGW